MRPFYTFCLLLVYVVLGPGKARAQAVATSRGLATEETSTTTAATPSGAATSTMVLKGRVESASGVLPGAVVTVRSYPSLKAVADTDGFFLLTVPTSAQPVAVTASFADFNDEEVMLTPSTQAAVVQLLVPHHIDVRRQDQLKNYLKTARKQVKRQLRQVQRS